MFEPFDIWKTLNHVPCDRSFLTPLILPTNTSAKAYGPTADMPDRLTCPSHVKNRYDFPSMLSSPMGRNIYNFSQVIPPQVGLGNHTAAKLTYPTSMIPLEHHMNNSLPVHTTLYYSQSVIPPLHVPVPTVSSDFAWPISKAYMYLVLLTLMLATMSLLLTNKPYSVGEGLTSAETTPIMLDYRSAAGSLDKEQIATFNMLLTCCLWIASVRADNTYLASLCLAWGGYISTTSMILAFMTNGESVKKSQVLESLTVSSSLESCFGKYDDQTKSNSNGVNNLQTKTFVLNSVVDHLHQL